MRSQHIESRKTAKTCSVWRGGVAEPLRADELLTSALRQALALVDVRVLDHFVVAGATVTSFAERGLL